MTAALPLARGFPRFREEDWRALVAKGVGQSAESLASTSDDGIAIGPIYGQTNAGTVIPGREPGAPWTIVQRIDIPDLAQAKAALRDDIDGGAGGLDLVFAASAATRLGGLPATAAGELARVTADSGLQVRVDAGEATFQLARSFLTESVGDLAIAYDPLATMAARGRVDRPIEMILADLANVNGEFDQDAISGTAVIADGRLWHAGGASEAQELAATLSAFVSYLRLLEASGSRLQQAVDRIGVALAADSDQSLTIAKLRAMRLLHARLLEVAGLAYRPCRIHSETAWRMMSRGDPRMNILRTTSAAFAAGVGGADSVTALPFTETLGRYDPEAHRLARNTQHILIEEAHVARVADPGAGAGAIEVLTGAFAAEAWRRFQAIEAVGGLLSAIRAGSLQGEIAATRQQRLRHVAHRKIGMIGVNIFLDPDEIAHEPVRLRGGNRDDRDANETVDALVAVRLAEQFELEADPSRSAM